jgi:transposase InsO family protein
MTLALTAPAPAPGATPIDGGRGATLRFTGVDPREGRIRGQGDDWVPLREASILLNRSEGDLRRKCAELERSGEAKKIRLPGARNETWCIHVSFDRRLMREAPAPETRSTDDQRCVDEQLTPEELLRAATEDRRREATLKALAVTMFRAFKADPTKHSVRDLPALRAELKRALGVCPSRRTLYAWDQTCPPTTDDPSRDATAFAAALLDQRAGRSGGGKGVSMFHPKAWEAFEAIWLDPRQPSIAYAHRRVVALAAEKGWPWPSERRVAQLVREKIPPSRACLMREGSHAWERKFAHTMQQAKDSWAPMERWDGDHARLDFFVRVARGGRDGGKFVAARPWLTCWLDWRTRTVVGYHLSLQPNASTIQLALLDGIRRMGSAIPHSVWIDNGKDYQAASLHGLSKRQRRAQRDQASRLGGAYEWTREHAVGILARVGIAEIHFATPYNHNGKARIERFFRSMHEDFDRSMPSYCGGNPDMVSEEHRAALLRDPANLPTLDEIRPKIDAWIAAYNASPRKGMDDLRDESSGELLAPIAFLDRFPFHTRTVTDADALALLEQRFTKPLKVGKLGVGVTIGGRKVYFGMREPALESLKGAETKVVVTYDPADTTMVRVYDASMRFLCVATENEQFGQRVSEDARRRAFAARREQQREAKPKKDRHERLMSDAELALAKQREIEVERTQADIKRAAPEKKDIPALRIVRTGLEGQREQIEREEMRKAAGAEHDPMQRGPAIGDVLDAMRTLRLDDSPARGYAASDHDDDGPSIADVLACSGGDEDEDPGEGFISVAEVLRG